MKVKNKFLLFMIVIFLCQEVIPQDKGGRSIQFEPSSEIKAVNHSENYISVILKRRSYPYYSTYLYSKQGKELFDYTLEKSRLLFVHPVDKFNSVIIIVKGWEAGYGDEGSPDIIKAIDLRSKSTIWETTSNAGSYEISKDQQYLLTKTRPEEGTSILSIITTKDGSKKSLPYSYSAAAFYSNDKIVFVNHKMMKNPDYGKSHGYISSQKIRKIDEEIFHLKYQIRIGHLSRDSGEKKIKELESEKNKIILESEISDTTKSSNSRIARTKRNYPGVRQIVKCITLSIYNFKNDMIEIQKDLYEIEGDKIVIDWINSIGNLNVDMNNDVFLYGSLKNEDLRYYPDVFVKLDKELELTWHLKITKGQHLSIFNEGTNLDFLISGKKQSPQKINKIDGSLDNIDKSSKYFQNVRDQGILPPRIDYIEGIKVNKTEAKISFISE